MQGYQVKGDVKINGQPASLDYRKPTEGDADIKLPATLDDASRARLGLDLGPAVSGAIPIKVIGKIASSDHDSKVGIEADLTSLKLDNILPGWVKVPGKSGKATFNVVQKPQSTRFEDIVVDGGGVSIKGSLEVDQNGDLMNANFPTYSPSEGDKTSLKAERGPDGVVKVDDARRRVRRPRLPQIGDLRQGGRCQEQDQEHRFRRRPQARRGRGLQWRGAAQRRCQDVAAQRYHQEFYADRQGRARHAGDRGFARPRAEAGTRRDRPADQRCRRVPPLHRHLLQDDRRPACAGDGAADGRTHAPRKA